jgi:hypothetical protein
MRTPTLSIPTSSAVKLLACLLVLAAFGFALLYPNNETEVRLKGQIQAVSLEIEEQKLLFPYAQALDRQLTAKPYGDLPMPQPQAMRQDQLYEVVDLVEQAALKAGLTPQSLLPDPVSLSDGRGLLLLNGVFLGEFGGLHEFFLGVGAIPSVRHVERLRIEENGGKTVIQTQIWLAMGKA